MDFQAPRSQNPAAAFEPAVAVVLSVAAAAATAAAAERWLDPQSLSLLFVVPIVAVAIRYGLVASLSAALLSATAVNFLFVEPRHTFVVARPQDAAALVLFAIVAAMASAIAASARTSALQAKRQADQARLLQRLVAELAEAADEDAVASATLAAADGATGARSALVSADGRSWGAPASPDMIEAGRWAMGTRTPFLPTPPAAVETVWAFWPVNLGRRAEYALGAPFAASDAEGMAVLDQIAAQAGLAFQRVEASREAETARRRAETERLKADLLAGVSHDLRTPLATIMLNVQAVRRFADDQPAKERDALLATAETEAGRLAAMVEALLDASRIGEGGTPVRLGPTAPSSLVRRACAEAVGAKGVKRLKVDAPDTLPLVTVDEELAVRALANLIDNALRHGADGPVRVTARLAGAGVRIEVLDEGPGLGDDPERLFDPFARGRADDGRAPGLGLGLSLARSYLQAQGASLTGESRPKGGARFVAVFPLAERGVGHGG